MTRSNNLLTTSAALAALLAVAACDQPNDRTVGQRADSGIAAAKSEMNDAKEALKGAATNVGAAAKDATITTMINAAFVADDHLKALKIDVDTKDGKVVLTGTAPDIASRDRATVLARAVDGVTDVENRLAVQPKG